MSISAILGVNTSKTKSAIAFFFQQCCVSLLLGKMNCLGWKESLGMEPHQCHWALGFCIVSLLI